MATRKVNALEEEKMTDTNIERVIELLEPTEEGKQPITKKLACELLGMSYNTTRLGTIITAFKERKAKEKQRRAEKRGKPVEKDELVYAVQEYLSGEPIDAISKALYRSPSFVKKILEDNGAPIRVPGHSYFDPQLIPDAAIRDRFTLGEIVYSARYDTTARIDAEQKDSRHGGWIYRVWLQGEKHSQSAYQPAYELASLEHLRTLGVKI